MVDFSVGGGGFGGWVVFYQFFYYIIFLYRGVYNVYGGQGNFVTGVEFGALGIVYIEDLITGVSFLLVDNNGQKQRVEKSEIFNEGRRLDLGIDEVGYYRGLFFMFRVGYRIQLLAVIYVLILYFNCENYDFFFYVLMNLFDQILAVEKYQYYTVDSGSVIIIIRLVNNIIFVNYFKIYFEFRFLIKFKVLYVLFVFEFI